MFKKKIPKATEFINYLWMNHISWQSIQLFTANRGKVRAPETNLFIFPITVKNHIYIDILC